MTALTEDAWGYVTFEGAPRWVGPVRAEVDYWKARALAAEAKLPSTHGDAGTISSSIPGVQQRP
jgi:hypothetical protein